MRLVITNEGEAIRQAFIKEKLNAIKEEKKKMESSMMNFDNSIQSLNFEMTGQLGGTSKMISGKGNALVNSGRNQMNNEYKSYLQGNTNNQTPAPGGMSLGAKHARGASMGPAFSTNGTNNKLGEIKEIEVSKPDIRLSKELKQKL
jgi:hypothetical protein